ncbi:MAG TPA: polyphosphate kinase 2 family protein, partial [Gammaproteobacteria bacterium]|nr:polyphosphate kinase 2 family protein [Gammaproteobacteria bacterium]
MFTATPHPLLVPYDGSFDARHAATKPAQDRKSDHWKAALETEARALGDSQYRLYADGRYALLLVFQALDAAGKDSTIRHVFTGVNPCGLDVIPFKQPSRAESAHDFLWRTAAHLPERGTVAVFNRSHYEEVIVVRVHPQYLAAQRQPVHPQPELWVDRHR